MGDSKSPMYFIAVACVTNIALDYLFIGLLHMGPAGAALGIMLSQAVSVVVSFVVMKKRKTGISPQKSDFKPRRAVMGEILKIGMPIALQDGLIQVAFIGITVIANNRGLNDAAAVGIVEKIIGFLFLVPLLHALRRFGARSAEYRRKKAGACRKNPVCRNARRRLRRLRVNSHAVCRRAGRFAVRRFCRSRRAEVVRAGGQYLRGYIWDCIFAGIHFSFSGYFCACGKSLLSFLHNIVAIVLVRIPGVYLTSTLFPDTLLPMGLATAAGSLLSVIICVISFAVIHRKERRLTAGA